MNDLKLFNSPEFGGVRVVTGMENEPWFCAVDVCRALGYANPRDAIAKHIEDGDVAKRDTPTTSGIQSMTFVNESGLYSLIFGSKLDSAKAFKKWVTSEVLPSIRRTGGYMTAKQDDSPEMIMARAVMVAQDTIRRYEQRCRELESSNRKQESEILSLSSKVVEMKPKADYCDVILSSRGSVAVTQIAKDYGMSAQEFNGILHAIGVQYKVNSQWVLYAKYQGHGYTDSRTGLKKNSREPWVGTMWTQKGRMFLYTLLKKDGVLPVMERPSGYRLPKFNDLRDEDDFYR